MDGEDEAQNLSGADDKLYRLCGLDCMLAAEVGRKKEEWMAERLVTLPAKQVAWVRFPVPARPTFSVGKWLFSVTLRQGLRSRALKLRL
jgi:hypothetical protein